MLTSIDQDLHNILTGGAKSTKNKKTTKSIKSIKQVKKAKSIKSIKSTGSKKKSKSINLLESGNETKNDFELARQKRPIVAKKNADDNKEYISVKNEKPPKTDNSYKPYDMAFLKRLKKSKADIISSDEDTE